MKRMLLAAAAVLCHPLTNPSGVQAQTPAYQNQELPFDVRVSDLVGRMTLEEKVSQMKDVAPAIERLGIPEYNWWNEALHGGARSGLATSFRSEEHTSELQSQSNLVCRLLLEKKKKKKKDIE